MHPNDVILNSHMFPIISLHIEFSSGSSPTDWDECSTGDSGMMVQLTDGQFFFGVKIPLFLKDGLN